MMNKPLLTVIAPAVICVALLLFGSCKKIEEKIIDCLGQTYLVEFEHSQNSANARTIDFRIAYSGELKVASVILEYGDGQSETISGLTASHTYANPGNYQVKAKVTLQQGKGTCQVDPVKQVIVHD